MVSHRLLARRASTPVQSPISSSRGESLPSDMMIQTCHRVGIVGTVFAGLWTLTGILNLLFGRLLWHNTVIEAMWPIPTAPIIATGLSTSLLVVYLASRLRQRPQLLVDVGSGFLVITCLLVGLFSQWNPLPVSPRVSWIAVFILLYPAIVPNTPARTLWTALIAASMDPLGLWFSHLRGVRFDPSPLYLVWDFMPSYVAAFLSVIPVKIIRGLGHQVKKARELGSYRLEEVLGRGGMGEVYRASHQMLARPAAVKVIRSEVLGASSSEEARVIIERFRREAEAVATLRSPHTIDLYDFGVSGDGTFFFVMELLDGLDLHSLIERFGPVPPERAVHLIRQACHSLDEAHARGMVHRDVKPSNIFTCRMGLEVDFVKVLDFGLVKAAGEKRDQDPLLTAPEATTGTPAFMAPEVIRGDAVVDHRLDIYALGCVTYWLVTGRLVFEAPNALQMMYQHANVPPIPLSRRSELKIPAALDEVVLACLAKRPEQRPRTAGELSRLLAHAVPGEEWIEERAHQWWEHHRPESARAKGTACDLMLTKTMKPDAEAEVGEPFVLEDSKR